MNQFFSVFKFEFFGQLKNKISIIITVAIVLVVAVTLSYPRIVSLFDDGGDIDLGNDDTTKIAVYNSSTIDEATLMSSFGSAFTKADGYSVYMLINEDSDGIYESTSKTLETLTSGDSKTGLVGISRTYPTKLEDLVRDGAYDTIIEVKSPTSFKYIVDTVGLYDSETQIASSVLQTIDKYTKLRDKGFSDEEIASVLTSEISVDTVITGKDQTQSFLYTYAIIMVLYMVLLLYGQFIASSVASEKSTRAMEVLITSARPMNLMFGKVIGSGCAGLLQLLIVLGSTVGFYQLNKDIVENGIVKSLFGMPVSVAVYAVVFFILGYFIYAFMFGAAGSLASRAEDLGALTMPINIIFIGAFMVAIFGMTGGGVNDTFFIVCSFLPTFAPMIMLVRICMGTVAAWEIVVSILIQLLTIGGLGVLCAKIYRAGVLMYGNTPKIRDIFKILKQAKT